MNIYLEQVGFHATLTTWIYTSMWQLYAAIKSGNTGYIHWPLSSCLHPYRDNAQFAIQPNMFDWYFKQLPLAPVPERENTWIWERYQPEMAAYSLMSQPLEVIKEWYREHLGFSEAVEARGQAFANKYHLNFDKIIGLSWRGTDNVTDGRPRLPIDLYYPFIDYILESDPGLRIMATAEEQHILDPLLQRYGSLAFEIQEFVSAPTGGKQNPERFCGRSGFERGMQPALMVWLFSKCKYYIKNRSSSGAVASWLSTGKIFSLAHPETLGYDVPPILHPKTGVQLWP